MNKLKNFIVQHKKASLLALFALIVFTGFSITSAMNVAVRRAEDTSMQENSSIENTDSNGGESPKAKLTDSQSELIENYDDKTKKLIGTICSSIWSSNNGKSSLRFYDTYYVETVDGVEENHPYAIARVDYGTNGSDTEIDSIVFETDTGSHIVTYTLAIAEDGNSIERSTLSSSSMFHNKDSLYECADPVKSITIKGMNSEITDLLGGDSEKLVSELSKWCSTHYPTVTEATWEKAALIDYETGIISTNFTLSTESPVAIAVTYKTSDGTFTFNG